jgi:hypothetical protein
MKNAPQHQADKPFEIRDDNAAQHFLLQLGILNAMPKKPVDPAPWAALEAFEGHPTHWILAARFEGFPADNGWLVIGQPKSAFSHERFVRWALEFRNQVFPEGVDYESAKPVDPAEN